MPRKMCAFFFSNVAKNNHPIKALRNLCGACKFWMYSLLLNVSKSVFKYKGTYFCPEKADLF